MQLRTFIIILTITFAFSQDPEALLRQGETQLESGDLDNAENFPTIAVNNIYLSFILLVDKNK